MHLHLRAKGLARRLLRISLLLVVLALAACGAYLGVLQINGNFHVVIADELYRSAQLTPAEIAVYTKRYGIRTIVNLRGKGEGSEWYDDEVVAAKGLGVASRRFPHVVRTGAIARQGQGSSSLFLPTPRSPS